MIKSIKEILLREIRFIIHDKNLISILLIAPIFYAFFYTSIYMNKTENDVAIIIVDIDNSTLSKKITRLIDAHQLLSVYKTSHDFSEAKADLLNNRAQAILFIPSNFEAELKQGKGGYIKLLINTTKFLVSNDINKAVNEVIGGLNYEIRLQYFLTNGYSVEQSKNLIEPLKTVISPLFNFTESYGDFLIPGVLLLILHQTLLIGLSESIAKERENNSLKDLYYLSNKSISSLIIGKGIFYGIIYSSYALFFFTIVFTVFKINVYGSAIALALSTLLMIATVIFLSIFISSFFERKIIAIQYLTLSSYPIFLISGYSFPLDSMPMTIKIISWLIPFTPYSRIAIRITQMGASFHHVTLELIHLILLSILYFSAAYIRINYLLKQK
ncbi:MAG: ABC transporter permease [Melioribacteraceae bacterium]